MKFIVIALAAFLLFSGCATGPEKIDRVYLSGMTPDESARISKKEAEFIEKKKEADRTAREPEIVRQRQAVNKKETAALEAKSSHLSELEKLSIITSDEKKKREVLKLKADTRAELQKARAYFKFFEASNKAVSALVDAKKSELAVKAAELDYEKALIAKTYQLKMQEGKKESMIDDMEYKKSVEDQKVKLEDNKRKYDKALKDMSATEEEYK